MVAEVYHDYSSEEEAAEDDSNGDEEEKKEWLNLALLISSSNFNSKYHKNIFLITKL